MQHPEGNRLFPVFFKLEQLQLLIVGGGAVGLEKMQAVLANAPKAPVRLVASWISEEVRGLAALHPQVQLFERPFETADLEGADLVIVAVNVPETSAAIRAQARAAGKLVNVADQPALCDFYLGSIVQKGDLKLAISTNGKSPTIAKRLREVFDELLPDELDELLQQMPRIRSRLSGDFAEKVRRLNELTKGMAEGNKK